MRFIITSSYVSAHELTIISLTHCQDKHSRNKRESNYLTCSHAKAKGKMLLLLCFVCVMCQSALRVSKDEQIFSSTPLLQRGRYNIDHIELFGVANK